MTSHHRLAPFGSALLAVALFSLMDAVMKGAALAAGTYSAMLLRGFCGIALTVPAFLITRQQWPRPRVLKVHLTRGLVATAMAFTFFWGITQMPLAEAIALSFIAPLIALFLAVVVLGERVERRAILASLLGLAGVAVIAIGRLQAGGGSGHGWLGIASILASALLYAWNLILQRQQALLARPLEIATFQNGVVSLALVGLSPWLLRVPGEVETWAMIAAAAALAMSAAMLFSWAYARAETQALIPLEYSAFVWAGMFGWLLFGEGVRPATLIGAALIVTACWIAAPRKKAETGLA